MTSGESLEVLATDLAFKPDIHAWARRTGNEVTQFEEGDVMRAVIRLA